MAFKRSLDVDKGTRPAKRQNGYRTKRKSEYGPVTQLGEYLNGIQEVARSIRVRSTILK